MTNVSLASLMQNGRYHQYVYGYPHKTAYRPLDPVKSLAEVWANEPKDALFLYTHIPFCEMRCGFCNLFTAANPVETVVEDFLLALERETKAAKSAIGKARFSQSALGGGTPTFLSAPQLERVFSMWSQILEAPLGSMPLSVEVSPESVTKEKLKVIERAGATRISMGVQSFVEQEVAALKRPQKSEDVFRAIEWIRAINVETLNLDFIYGAQGQTTQTFIDSLQMAIGFGPEELYLYPLYVRPLTFLGKAQQLWDDARADMYRAGRDFLVGHGYAQHSMRLFRKVRPIEDSKTDYRCQEDGMLGLGCGARSYTNEVHYSHEWAVASRAVRGIIEEYSQRNEADFSSVKNGFVLNLEEQKRRYVILSLLGNELDSDQYVSEFSSKLLADFPQLMQLRTHAMAEWNGTQLHLTPKGVEWSDVIGPWLHSSGVDELMTSWEKK
jgi:oxygen-independent coproporphyrinogen III oxidase